MIRKEAAIEAVKEIISSEGEVGNTDVWGMRKSLHILSRRKTKDIM